MKNFIIFLLFSLTVISCEKKQERVKIIKNITDVDEMFQLKNYKTQVRIKVNDSIDRVTAHLDNLTLTGNFSTKMDSKTGIWTVTNSTNSKIIQIDYLVFSKNDIFKNQVIFKEHNKIDSSVSKFYVLKDKNLNKLILYFFSPKMKDMLSNNTKVAYRIYRGSKKIKTDSIVYKNIKNGKYFAYIKYDFKKGDKIKGYFSDFALLKNPKSKDSLLVGDNTIYFREKIE
ncbi:hypothetical protein [Chryseobacterium sp. SIMBA_029]|uniref:hypothetical protein n=1 Tax=Chryseobacterium sp. SIMBA_029 TaxID=3085772 RepID=UPI00397D9D0A